MDRSSHFKFTLLFILFSLFGLMSPEPARSQNAMGIAAVVNNDVITLFDLNARLRMAMANARMPNRADLRKRFAPQVLSQMIDDKLMLQEAERRGVKVSDKELDAALDRIAKQNKMSRSALLARMKKGGLPENVLRDQIRAQIAWGQLMQQMAAARVNVGEGEVNRVLANLRGKKGDGAFDISTIYISVANPKQAAQIKSSVDRLHQQLVKSGNFAEIASQFSQDSAAQSGGRRGWVTLDELEKPVARVVQGLAPGRISNPIISTTGIYIVKLHDKGVADPELLEGSGSEESIYRMQQIVFMFPNGANKATRNKIVDHASQATRGLRDCHDLAAQASALKGGQLTDLGEVRHSALPPDVRGFIARLPDNTPGRPLIINNSATVVMVCSRKTVPSGDEGIRKRIRDRLTAKRREQFAHQYLQNLRQSAFVDIRL